MLRTLSRFLFPNPFDAKLKRCAKQGGKKILLAWNRGLGDIALGLYAMVHRTREIIPQAEITFLTRENLRDGFSMLEGIKTVIAPSWKRGEPANVKQALHQLGIDPKSFDLIVEKPSPTDWVRWQRGQLVPRLKWDPRHDPLWKKFDLPDGPTYIGIQVIAETDYGLWRNWPIERWRELFDRLEKMGNVKILLFGFGAEPRFSHSSLIDLRGKTTLFELLSIIKNRCRHLILPDSGILSMAYYLDVDFPIQVLSLWADPHHGILKQAVASPNRQLVHHPLIGAHRDLFAVSANTVLHHLFPLEPLRQCPSASPAVRPIEKGGAILLAGGQGSRLSHSGPKGTFLIEGKSLFQWICEQVPPSDFPIAVMTSPLNHRETVSFFEKHRHFGREIFFFQQETLPLLDEKRNTIEIQPGTLAQGPDGNGSIYRSFARAGLLDLFQKRNIDVVAVVPVENPLAHPADPALFDFHRSQGADATIKCVGRLSSDEKMGALCLRDGKIEIVEYIDLIRSQRYFYSNAGMMSLSLSFLAAMASVNLPLHWVWKTIVLRGEEMGVWKRERFLFDALAFANKVEALSYPREMCYAPLKSLEQLQGIQKLLSSRRL